MRKLMEATPEEKAELKERLIRLGGDSSDGELMTNAALLGMIVMEKGMEGDLEAVDMAFAMAGIQLDGKKRAEVERAKIAREKLEIEKSGGSAKNDVTVIHNA